MGRTRGGTGKPHLRGTEATARLRRTAAGAREPDGGGPSGKLHAQGRRRRLHQSRNRPLASGLVVFEVQENSDVTFRLYDWDRVDAKTGKPRPLQVEQALACIDFTQVAIGPVAPVVESTTPVRRERLFHCEHFSVWRHPGTNAVHCRRGGHAAGSGVHRRRGTTGTRRRRAMPSAGRRAALAGGGRRVCLSAARRGELVRGRNCRKRQTDEKADRFRPGRHACRKQSRLLMPKWRRSCVTSSASSKWPSFPVAIGRNSRTNCSPIFPTTNT